ncbi:MAG: PQQ-binding-like beta-propeller repeat protein [Phycisphaeraceae bacterium]
MPLRLSHTLALAIIFMAYPAFAEQTGPKRRVLAADYSGGKKKLALIDAEGKILWEQKINNIHDVHLLDNGNILTQTDWTRVVEFDKDGKVVWEYDAAKANGNEGKKIEVHAVQRVGNGLTMIAESGSGRIIEVDKDGKIQKEIKLKLNKPNPHRDTRNARKLDNGHYLVAHEGDLAVREYDGDGKVVWEYEAKTQVYSAIRLKNGNTLIGSGSGHSVIEVSPDKRIVWAVSENDLPGCKLAWVTQVARLENGNTIIVNCHAGPSNPQIVEVTPEKKIVWSFKDFEVFGNAMPVAQVLDIKGEVVR